MKAFVILLALTFSVTSFAKQGGDQERTLELIHLLIENSKDITVVDGDSKEKNIAYLLAGALSLARAGHNSQVVITVSSECKNTTPQGLVGASYKSCSVTVLDGDFKVNAEDGTLKGPTAESSITFSFETVTPVVPNAKPSLKDNVVKVSYAG